MRRMPSARRLSALDQAVARQMAASAAPWPEVVTIGTGMPGPDGAMAGEPDAAAIERATAAIRPRGPGHVWRPAQPVVLPG